MPFPTTIAQASNLLYYRDVNACAQGRKGPANHDVEMTVSVALTVMTFRASRVTFIGVRKMISLGYDVLMPLISYQFEGC